VKTDRSIEVDVGVRVVRRNGTEVHLAPKAFDLLLILVRNQPNAVTHARLHAALWPGVHVSDTSLAALVTQLRKALGDGDHGRVIRTLHRVGYAFLGDALIVGEAAVRAAPLGRLLWRGVSFDVQPGESLIGRDRASAIQIDADSVSRRHAVLHATEREVLIEDVGSKNGTWIAGERIAGTMALADGAAFRIGSETLRFEAIGADRPTRTATGSDADGGEPKRV
jgi:DNA-binding winged helix-turn-helix (wHTH) protein